MLKHGTQQPEQQKYLGNYRAKVVDNEDPLGAGRIRVRVYQIHGDQVLDDHLPWAIYCDPFMGGDVDLGGLIVPDEGSDVWVFFEAGCHEHPAYFAGAPSKPDMPSEKARNYPKNKVFKTKAGFTFEMDDTDGDTRLRIYQPSGNEKVCDNDGNVDETIVGNVTEDVGGDHTETLAGTLTITADGVIKLTTGSTFSVSNSSEELVKVLSDTIQEILNITTNTIYGPMPPNNLAAFAALKQRLDTFLE